MHFAEDNSLKWLDAHRCFPDFSTRLYFDILESNFKPRVTQVSPGMVYCHISKVSSE